MNSLSERSFVMVLAEENEEAVRSLASPVRLNILRLLREAGPLNVNDIGRALGLPQSTVATNVQILEKTALIHTETVKASKGQQKICSTPFDEIVIRLARPPVEQRENLIEVSMPLGLYTGCHVSAPCGLCSQDGVIGLLDVPDTFLDPGRMQAALIWFSRGHVEYQFPNNAKLMQAGIESLEFSLEMSSEVPGTNVDWPSDISLWVNGVKIGTWTSPGDYGDKRGIFTPRWWKLKGSQYGRLTTWHVSRRGTYMDGEKLSAVNLAQLDLGSHHSIRLRIGIEDGARNPGGLNIFGRQFGNHDQDIVMRLRLRE
jgi:predicted transcriptional regulator